MLEILSFRDARHPAACSTAGCSAERLGRVQTRDAIQAGHYALRHPNLHDVAGLYRASGKSSSRRIAHKRLLEWERLGSVTRRLLLSIHHAEDGEVEAVTWL